MMRNSSLARAAPRAISLLLALSACAHHAPSSPTTAAAPVVPPATPAPESPAPQPPPPSPSPAPGATQPSTAPSPAAEEPPTPVPAAPAASATTPKAAAATGSPGGAAVTPKTAPPKAAAPATAPAAPQHAPASAGATVSAPAPAALDLASLEQRLRDTRAIGVFTKLSLKNQVDDLLAQFRAFHHGQSQATLAQLRQKYELLFIKVVSLLQDGDAALATAISSSREAIWAVLADPRKFASLTAHNGSNHVASHSSGT